MKYDENGEQLVEHHTKYEEIHGYDETVWMTKSEHFKLHKRLREEGKCNIPIDEMSRIATTAHMRTEKRKEYKRDYYQKNKDKAKANLLRHRENNPNYQREYRAKKRMEIS